MVGDNDAIRTSSTRKVTLASVPLEAVRAKMALRKIVFVLYLYIHQTDRNHADKAAGGIAPAAATWVDSL